MLGRKTIIGIEIVVLLLVMVVGILVGYSVKKVAKMASADSNPTTLDNATKAKVDSAASDAYNELARQMVVKQYGLRLPLAIGLNYDLDCNANNKANINDYLALKAQVGNNLDSAIAAATSCTNMKFYLTALKNVGYTTVTENAAEQFYLDIRDGTYGISTTPNDATNPPLTRPANLAGNDMSSTYFLNYLMNRLLPTLSKTTVNTVANSYLTYGYSVVGGRTNIKSYASTQPLLFDLSYDFNCDNIVSTPDVDVISGYWRNGTVINTALVNSITCKPLKDYLGNLLSKNITTVPISEVTRIGKEVSDHTPTMKPIVAATMQYTACIDGKDYIAFNGTTAERTHLQYQDINNNGNCTSILTSNNLTSLIGQPNMKATYTGNWSICKKARITGVTGGRGTFTKAIAADGNERWSAGNNLVEINMNDAKKVPFTIYIEDGGSGAALYNVSFECTDYNTDQYGQYADYYRVEFLDPTVIDGRYMAYTQYAMTAPYPIQQVCQSSRYYNSTTILQPKTFLFDRNLKVVRVVDLTRLKVFGEATTMVQTDAARSKIDCTGVANLTDLLLPSRRVNTY